MKRKIIKLCECDCGKLVKKNRRFAKRGHNKGFLGGHHSEEARQKIGKAARERPAYNTGKHLSEETKMKLREAFLGKPRPDWVMEKIRKANTGKKRSREVCERMSESKKGIRLSEEHKLKLSKAGRRRKHSEETKKKISKSKIGILRSQEIKEKISISLKGNIISLKTKEKLRLAGKRLKEETGRRSKELWKNSDYVSKQMKARNVYPNKEEKRLESILNKFFPNEYKYVGDGEFILAGKCPDFVNVNGKKKIIELYGEYWHRNDDPQDRIDLFKQYGYDTLVIWERELKEIKFLEEKIQIFNE